MLTPTKMRSIVGKRVDGLTPSKYARVWSLPENEGSRWAWKVEPSGKYPPNQFISGTKLEIRFTVFDPEGTEHGFSPCFELGKTPLVEIEKQPVFDGEKAKTLWWQVPIFELSYCLDTVKLGSFTNETRDRDLLCYLRVNNRGVGTVTDSYSLVESPVFEGTRFGGNLPLWPLRKFAQVATDLAKNKQYPYLPSTDEVVSIFYDPTDKQRSYIRAVCGALEMTVAFTCYFESLPNLKVFEDMVEESRGWKLPHSTVSQILARKKMRGDDFFFLFENGGLSLCDIDHVRIERYEVEEEEGAEQAVFSSEYLPNLLALFKGSEEVWIRPTGNGLKPFIIVSPKHLMNDRMRIILMPKRIDHLRTPEQANATVEARNNQQTNPIGEGLNR